MSAKVFGASLKDFKLALLFFRGRRMFPQAETGAVKAALRFAEQTKCVTGHPIQSKKHALFVILRRLMLCRLTPPKSVIYIYNIIYIHTCNVAPFFEAIHASTPTKDKTLFRLYRRDVSAEFYCRFEGRSCFVTLPYVSLSRAW